MMGWKGLWLPRDPEGPTPYTWSRTAAPTVETGGKLTEPVSCWLPLPASATYMQLEGQGCLAHHVLPNPSQIRSVTGGHAEALLWGETGRQGWQHPSRQDLGA